MNPGEIRTAIANKAHSDKLDLTSPHHAFVVAKFTPQAATAGPLLWTFESSHEAQSFAERQYGEVFLMSTNPQHGLQRVQGGKLVFIDEGTKV